MTPIQRWTSVLLAVTVLFSGGTAWAQATFSVSSTASTVIRTGHAEPLGALSFSVISGTTVAEIIPIDLSPAVLTGDADAIVISTNGVQATGFSAMVDPDAGQVRLHVPGGVGPGTLVSLEGLRISVPASGIETLDARISTVAKTGSSPEAGSSRSSHESPTPSSSILRPIRSTPIARAVCSSTISATSRSVRALPGRFPRTGPGRPPQRKSFSRCPRYPGTPNSGSRRLSDHRPGRV